MRHTSRAAAVVAVCLAGLLSGCSSWGADDDGPSATASAGSGDGREGAAGSDPDAPTPGPASKIPAEAAQPPQMTLPPPAAPTQAHLTLPLPDAASAQGKIVAGFPTDIVPVPPSSTVVASSVTGQGDRLQLGLETTSAAAPGDILEFYRVALVGLGFVEEVSPASDGSVAAAFIRAGDGIVVSVRTALGGGSQISVAGTLQAVD